MQHLSVEQICDLSQCKLKIIIFATLNIASPAKWCEIHVSIIVEQN